MIWKIPKTKLSGQYRWEVKPTQKVESQDKYPPQLMEVLAHRNVTSTEAVKSFLAEPSLSAMPDPFSMVGMQEAVDRLTLAKDRREKVMIFGDNDPDGTSGSLVLLELLRALNLENVVYLPDRLTEGHAMTKKAVMFAIKNKVQLVITVDTGIREVEGVRALKEKGIETIVTDHHLFPPKLPDATAIIDPRRPDDTYGFDGLCGAAVAFVFAQAVVKSPLGDDLDDKWLLALLDVVAIATIADVVPLVGPNRVLLKLGLKSLRATKRVGLKALFDVSRVTQQEIDEHTIMFEIAPRINAISRVEHASTAFSLMIVTDEEEAIVLAKDMDRMNRRRQKEVGDIAKDALKRLEGVEIGSIVIDYSDKWPPTMLGIATSRVRGAKNRPAFLCAKTDDGIRCSGRAPESFNLVDAMDACGGDDFFVDYGGHPQAAGCTIREDWFELFRERMGAYADKHSSVTAKPLLSVDIELKPHEVGLPLLNWFDKLAPFGKKNSRPRALVRGLEVLDRKPAGLKGSGVRMQLVGINGGRMIKAIARDADALPFFRAGDKIDVVAELRRDTFKGRDEVVLAIIDTKIAEEK